MFINRVIWFFFFPTLMQYNLFLYEDFVPVQLYPQPTNWVALCSWAVMSSFRPLQQTKEAKSESEISFASDVIDLLMWHFYCTISRSSTETATYTKYSLIKNVEILTVLLNLLHYSVPTEKFRENSENFEKNDILFFD